MLPPRKITIQPTAFLEGPSDVPRRVRPRAQQATGWLQPGAGGRLPRTHPELNKAVQRGDGVGPVPSGSLGAGRWRACTLGLGTWVWPNGEPPPGCWGVSTPLSAVPAAFRPSWRVQSCTPAPTPPTPRLRTRCGTQAPEASLSPHLGGEAPQAPLQVLWTPVSCSEHSPGPAPGAPADLVPDRSLEVPSALRTFSGVALNVRGPSPG